MNLKRVGIITLATALVAQAPLYVSAAKVGDSEKKSATLESDQTLSATSDLTLTVGEPVTKTLHVQDQASSNSEWGSYVSDVKVILTDMDGINYKVVYGPKSDDGTHYQYLDVVLSGTPTKAGAGSFSLEYYDGAGNGGVYPYTVNTQSTTTVEYVDQNGTKIADDTVQKGDLNTAYTTEAKIIDGYTLDETKLPSNQNGQFGETNQTVTYTYTNNQNAVNKGTVGISFYSVDGKCKELVSSLNLSYAYPDGVPTDTVTFGDLAKDATYNDLRSGTLDSEILWSDVLSNMVAYMSGDIDGAQFEAAVGASPEKFDLDGIAANFEGYEFDEATYQENLSKMVTFEQDGGNVNLQVPFKKIAEVQAAADVTVKYVDTKGNELAPADTLSGNVGADYTSEAKTIAGWYLKETPANATGTFSDKAQTVTYVYQQIDNSVKSEVTINFVDKNGNKIAPSKKISGELGTQYKAVAEDIQGYKLIAQDPANASGVFTEEPQTVNFVYEKDGVPATNNGTGNGHNNLNQKQTSKMELPKTGDTSSPLLILFGGALVLGAFGLFFRRKQTQR
ncbi:MULTISPECIES: MucBP domain-containing protein [Listeria]|uniref:MucBP domain-containing protein n=1 Tax=Listeria TaxID=1637 RepID=UPI000B59634F|nr:MULTISPECIES: MucBP domain-containing protein [Listeria]